MPPSSLKGSVLPIAQSYFFFFFFLFPSPGFHSPNPTAGTKKKVSDLDGRKEREVGGVFFPFLEYTKKERRGKNQGGGGWICPSTLHEKKKKDRKGKNVWRGE